MEHERDVTPLSRGACICQRARECLPAAHQPRKTLMAETFSKLTLTLDSGDVVITLRPDLAPEHVARIGGLANEGFYDGVVFHRVIPGFMAQGGDPTGTGMSGSDKPNLKQEFNAEPHVRGTC